MKVELCSFSGYKIYPGHGRRYARIDGKVFQFLNAKCESAFLAKRNPRQINWTVLYRRKHKKGQSEEVAKKRTRRAVKFTRAITGASLAEIMAKRNQKPEVRKAQREQAIRAAKEAKKAKQAAKKPAAPPAKAAAKAAQKTSDDQDVTAVAVNTQNILLIVELTEFFRPQTFRLWKSEKLKSKPHHWSVTDQTLSVSEPLGGDSQRLN
uniref:Large ribosomal subunit protein eL24 n=1 Tax=Oreochromis niloticus TaxID=8128 RepID=A0A669BN00_ORENI